MFTGSFFESYIVGVVVKIFVDIKKYVGEFFFFLWLENFICFYFYKKGYIVKNRLVLKRSKNKAKIWLLY